MPKNDEVKKNGGAAYFIRIAGVLTLICSVIALLLAVVNMLTKDTIAANTEKEKIEAISRIFGDVDDAEAFTVEDHEVYLVKYRDGVLGYTVTVKPQGYGGEIEMLVGIEPGGSVVGIEIISMSETPGVGSKVKSDPNFLPQFKGMTGTLTIGENVDAISGASISSKAVTSGVNEALSVKFNAAEYAKDVKDTEQTETESETETDTETETEAETQNAVYSEDTHIAEALVGASDAVYEYRPSDEKTVADRDASYYVEHETTDTADASAGNV
ncbi:MAG: FMN-binding protein [Clostridia bacterium]|nr:FMN-binding protein [Clostridia bacterium]